jgi:FeS assembly SUF system protein
MLIERKAVMSMFDWLKQSGAPAHKDDEHVHDANEANDAGVEALRQEVIGVLRTIYDPEIPVNIYDLGLIYDLDVQESGVVNIRMTLTSPGCPVAQTFPVNVECEVAAIPGVTEANVELVWDPPWSREMISEPAKLELGLL